MCFDEAAHLIGVCFCFFCFADTGCVAYFQNFKNENQTFILTLVNVFNSLGEAKVHILRVFKRLIC